LGEAESGYVPAFNMGISELISFNFGLAVDGRENLAHYPLAISLAFSSTTGNGSHFDRRGHEVNASPWLNSDADIEVRLISI